MSEPSVSLSMEQEFRLNAFRSQVSRMSQTQAQDALVGLYHQLMLKENCYKEMLKKAWGIEPPAL